MKYNTISTSSLSSEGRKSTLTLYTDPDFLIDKVSSSESEISSVRSELEIVQRTLSLQTRRCRQLVTEYTRRLQEKEQQYQSEKLLREDQLAKVLRALLIFEARLKQEQKYISHQLAEKDTIIKKQREHIHHLSNQYCKHCNQFYTPHKVAESFGSSSEYVVTDYHDSNLESLDSSSETYATISNTSEKNSNSNSNSSPEVETKDVESKLFLKNKSKDGSKRCKRVGHRKSIGDYYEVLKMRNENMSPSSDNTSNDYEQLESLPGDNMTDKISVVSDRIEGIFKKTQANLTEDNLDKHDQLIENNDSQQEETKAGNDTNNIIDKISIEEESVKEAQNQSQSKTNETIPQVFEEESNDNWYASDAEDDDIRREWNPNNNPNFLECMNQILLQNINDNINSPPKTPTMERKSKIKRVKFSDEEDIKEPKPPEVKVHLNALNIHNKMADYYETPIQKTPNFYETPQSIYSNDYEQILSKCSEKSLPLTKSPQEESHYYVDMDTSIKSEDKTQIVRKSKILRTPPALPPKPANLLSKYKLPKSPTKISAPSIDSEPDYCSISELNLPPTAPVVQLTAVPPTAKKLNVVAEINVTHSSDNLKLSDKHVIIHSPKNNETFIPPSKITNEPFLQTSKSSKINNDIFLHSPKPNETYPEPFLHSPKSKESFVLSPKSSDTFIFPTKPSEDIQPQSQSHYDLDKNDLIVASKAVEKVAIQVAKQTSIRSENLNSPSKTNKAKVEPEIPKLPQVSEIIIPDENEPKKDERIITHDNYIKINSQLYKPPKTDTRRPIIIGSSVSSLITTFNNQQLMAEMSTNRSPPRGKLNKKLFSSFENLQNIERHTNAKSPETPSFEFDLSQNFEEFKLDECDMDEYGELSPTEDTKDNESLQKAEQHVLPDVISSPNKSVEIVRATDVNMPVLNSTTIEMLNQRIEKERNFTNDENLKKRNGEPTYEHFLECTGLSSKSILTPTRLMSNHKSILKPKDIKFRSKRLMKTNGFEQQGSTIKYWSEPFV